MRSLFLALSLLACTLPGHTQQTATPPAGSNWQHVQVLPLGISIHVNAQKRHSLCTLKAIDADTLTCDRDTGTGTKELIFQRPEIKNIKLARRGRSAVLGGAIGAGTGGLIGGIVDIHSSYFAVHGAFALIYAFAGAFAGAPTGYLTDFSASTIYRAN
jgi:hypothetical protein